MQETEIFDLVTANNFALIAIDGELGSGKTTLANRLANEFNIAVIHIDDYLQPGKNCYVDALDFHGLRLAISAIPGAIILEGVCLLYILDRLHLAADLKLFLQRDSGSVPYKSQSPLVDEVNQYIQNTHASNRTTRNINMSNGQTNELDVDIAYIKYNALVATLLSAGGVVALLVGAYILSSGGPEGNSAVFEVLGTKITAEGIGAVILGSSVLWAYFSYLSRPKYSRKRESRISHVADGSQHQVEEFVSATMAVASSTDEKSELVDLPPPPPDIKIVL